MRRSFVAALALGVGCTGGSADQPGGAAAGGAGARAIPVEVTTAWSDTVVDVIQATGQIEALQSIELRPEVEGRLVEIFAKEGTEVAAGAPLFKVDDAELRAQVARAEADRDLARQGLARARQLIQGEAASPEELEAAEARARSSQATLDLLELRLERTTVRAPFAGVLGARTVSLGDFVSSASRLISLQTANPQRAAFQVPERYAEDLGLGQTVRFTVAAIQGREFEGRVDFVDPAVQLPGRTITVKAVVPNPRRELQPGMFIEARLATSVRPDATVVPEDAVTAIQGGSVLWVVEENVVRRRRVDLGVRTPGFVEVRSGLAVGELVVVGGLDRLVDGASVSPTAVERQPTRPGSDAPSGP